MSTLPRPVLCFFLLLSLSFVAGCGKSGPSATQPHADGQEAVVTVTALSNPAAGESRTPRAGVTPGGRLFLSWIEKTGDTHALQLAFYDNGKWSPPGTIARGRGWMVNWADFQSVVAGEDGAMAAHWLERIGDSWNYGVRVRVSEDGGTTWGSPFWLHRDLESSEHGFVSILPEGRGTFRAAWLDARSHKERGEMELRSVLFGRHGPRGDEELIDKRVCDCCATSAARAGGDFVLIYRDRTPGEVRDISLSRRGEKAWSSPRPLHPDGWKTPG